MTANKKVEQNAIPTSQDNPIPHLIRIASMEQRAKMRWVIAAVGLIVAGLGLTFRAVRPAAAEVVQPDYVSKLRFLALGDSYTIGEHVKPADRWPMQLAVGARAASIDLSDPLIIARTGWTTGDLLSAVDATLVDSNFDLVMLLIGVNNQFQHRSTTEYQQQFVELLQRSIKAAKGNADHVIVLSIPDWGVMPFARDSDRSDIRVQIDAFNHIAKQACDTAHIAFVDITPVSRTAATQPALIAGDGLHPSREQYREWTLLALQPVCRILDQHRQ